MAEDKRRYAKAEIARLGDEIYETTIRPKLRPEDEGHLIAIDVESGEYEVGTDSTEVLRRLRGRIPQAETFLRRVGSDQAVVRFRGHRPMTP